MIGNSWWSDTARRGEEAKLAPPRAVISISGEPSPQEGTVEWTGTSGKTFDVADPPSGTTYIGRCVGKQLFISDVDEKRKKVEALVKIMAPASDEDPERVIGTFSSRPIKVISKPSKKRQSAKNLEREPSPLRPPASRAHSPQCASTTAPPSLFSTVSGRRPSPQSICVCRAPARPSRGLTVPPCPALTPGTATRPPPLSPGPQAGVCPAVSPLAAAHSAPDPFVIYIVDVNKPAGGVDVPPPPPPQPDYPSPPPNAITFTNNGSQIPVYYNQTVVLQCLTSGVVSPVLIIRKVDHATVVVGGGLQEGAKGVPDSYCPPGEVCGDPVSQLHKIAFEVYDAAKSVAPPSGSPGNTGSFLSCMGEKVNTYRPVEGRSWTSPPSSSPGSHPPSLPDSPLISTPTSTAAVNGATDYFARLGTSLPSSPPDPDYPPSSDGGRVKRGKRNSISSTTSAITKAPKGRRRQNSQSSTSSGRAGSNSSDGGASSGAVWQVDIGETSVWTIVGTGELYHHCLCFRQRDGEHARARPSPLQLLCSPCSVRLAAKQQHGVGVVPDTLKTRHADPRRRKIPDARPCGRGPQVQLPVGAGTHDEAQPTSCQAAHGLRRELLKGRSHHRVLRARAFPARRDSVYRGESFPPNAVALPLSMIIC